MKTIFRVIGLLTVSATMAIAAWCTGADPCTACKDCTKCGYCNSGKGSCGVIRNQDGKATAARLAKQSKAKATPAPSH